MRSYFLSTLIAAMCVSAAAQAQQVGQYTGMTKDGSSVTITVAQDPNDANLEVTVIGFGVSPVCKKSLETLNYIGIGFFDGNDIVGGKFSYVSSNFAAIDLVTSMTFKGTKSVSGKVALNEATFNPAFGHDSLIKDIQLCVSPSQTFTATFSGAPKHSIAPGTTVVGNQMIVAR